MPFNVKTKISMKIHLWTTSSTGHSLNRTTTTRKITASKCTKRLKVNPLLTFTNSPWISFIPGQLGVGLS